MSEDDLFEWSQRNDNNHGKYDDICRNYHGGNPESDEANLATRKAKDAARIIIYLLSHDGGLTCDELEDALGLQHQTCSARCAELKRDKIVIRKPMDSEHYERRLTRNGCWAAVLVLKEPSRFKAIIA